MNIGQHKLKSKNKFTKKQITMNIIEIKKQDINKAAEILSLSFKDDPIFRYIFKTREKYLQLAPWMFSTWVRWAMLFGRAWMTEDRNSVLLMRAFGKSEMSLWSMIRAGMLLTPVKLGAGAFWRFYFEIVSLLDKKHNEIMGSQPHWYGWMLGVNPANKGIGRVLLKYCFDTADQKQLPVFLETSIERNVQLYNYSEFEVKDKVFVNKGKFMLYFMVRQPKNK
jgi:hypothetical protein